MSGIILRTNQEPEEAATIVKMAGRRLGFSVTESAPLEISLTRGNFAASLLVGPLTAYCDFRVHIVKKPDGSGEVEIHRNKPWWTGGIGVGRVKAALTELADRIEDEIVDAGGKILDRATF